MDQFFAKFLKHIENEASSIEQEVFGIETSEEKWARWRKIIASRPKPRPLPTVETPSWLDHAEVHAAAEHCLELRKMQGSSQPPAPDGPPAEAKDSKGKEKASEDRITAQAEDLRRHFRIQEDKSQ